MRENRTCSLSGGRWPASGQLDAPPPTRLLNRKIVEQNRQCAICEVAFTSYNDIVPDHIDPRGMGGSRRDDHPENIQAVHFWCNGEKGSTREY